MRECILTSVYKGAQELREGIMYQMYHLGDAPDCDQRVHVLHRLRCYFYEDHDPSPDPHVRTLALALVPVLVRALALNHVRNRKKRDRWNLALVLVLVLPYPHYQTPLYRYVSPTMYVDEDDCVY